MEKQGYSVVNSGAGDGASPPIMENMPVCLSPANFSDNPIDREEALRNWMNVMAENVLLKQCHRDKLNEIARLRAKLVEMSEKRRREGNRPTEFNSADSYLDRTQELLGGLGPYLNPNTSLIVAEDNGEFADIRAYSLSESMMEWVEENKDDVIQKFGTGSVRAKEIVIGGLAGWTFSWVFKTFGKVAVTALGGGLLLLQLAHYRGYIVVDWNRVYEQLEQLDLTAEGTAQPLEVPAEASARKPGSKLNFLRQWHVTSYSAVGFLGGFIYNSYH